MSGGGLRPPDAPRVYMVEYFSGVNTGRFYYHFSTVIIVLTSHTIILKAKNQRSFCH